MKISIAIPKSRIAAYVLVAAGVALLGYVGIQYGVMYRTQRALSRQFAEQQERLAAQQNSAATTDSTFGAKPQPDSLIRLSIPKINLDAIVVEGSTRKALLKGPGHLETTAYPGEDGNVVITAHRDTFFRNIYELKNGDTIQVQRNGATFLYEVTGKKVVDPADMSVAAPTKDAHLTLITCYPTYYIGPAPERLVVFSRLLPRGAESKLEKTATSKASQQ